MPQETNRVTARKHGRNATRYTSAAHKCSVTIWPCGKGFGSILHRDGLSARRGFHANRADAIMHVGEWCDPRQGERYILDNDVAFANQGMAA